VGPKASQAAALGVIGLAAVAGYTRNWIRVMDD
jgi:hypothetical protein